MDVDDTEIRLVPTASENMLQPSSISERNMLTNGALLKKIPKTRVRSKSESISLSAYEKERNVVGNVVKPAKDKAHDRKPKNIKGQGKPKKSGAGGKGTWGKNGEVYEEEETNPDDPNYDSDIVESDDVILYEVTPDLSSAEFDKIVTPIIMEYFDHGITGEVAASLEELNITHLKHRIVQLAVSLALEKKGAQRELVSVLISDLFGLHILAEPDIEMGFQALMNSLDDLKLDTPDAAHVLGRFMARCVADDCLNPIYIEQHLEHPDALSKVSLDVANSYLQMKHGLVRLDTVWGLGGGTRPVKTLVKEIDLMIKEYLLSNDLSEFGRCVMDLDVPHFHHEIVYEAVIIALESGSDYTIKAIANLLHHLSDATMITEDQMISGFERVFDIISDLVLDIPRAYKYLDSLLDMCCRVHIIPLSLRQKAPSRGRKRFVSEGDFGISTKPL
ncbi:programmed cell death protein 4 isoform X1 [Hydra vulgaris]|uniref:Programmed cell death protein 4 n=1 Tax=Hydra vulgaris TaxID=6087 RepID=T2MCT4_HYDVU|nr:programmed cell death protein 4 [Hydra vulgaris]